MCTFCVSLSFWHPFGHLMGRLFSPLGRECPQKGKVFSSLGPWTRKRWCLTLTGATGASDISCFLESGPEGHAENDHRTRSLLVLGVKPSKRRPIESTITLDQPPDIFKSARKKQQKRITSIGSAVWAQPTRIMCCLVASMRQRHRDISHQIRLNQLVSTAFSQFQFP